MFSSSCYCTLRQRLHTAGGLPLNITQTGNCLLSFAPSLFNKKIICCVYRLFNCPQVAKQQNQLFIYSERDWLYALVYSDHNKIFMEDNKRCSMRNSLNKSSHKNYPQTRATVSTEILPMLNYTKIIEKRLLPITW